MKLKNILFGILSIFAIASVLGQEIDLEWDDTSTNEQGFIIERRDGPSATWEQIGNATKDIVAYQDTSFPINAEVSYRIYAFNQFGNSPYSNVITIITSPPSAPGNFRFNLPNGVAKFLRRIFGPDIVLDGEYNPGNGNGNNKNSKKG